MQKAIFFVCLFIYITLSSSNCNKKTDPIPEPEVTYQPTTAGSQWSYSTTGTAGGSSINTNYTLTATDRDTSSSGRTYRVFTNSTGPNEYYNKTGNDYFRIASFAGLPQPLDALYLKDNQAAGFVWSEIKNLTVSGAPFPIPVTLKFTIVGNKYDTSFSGKTFKDVIRVRLTLETNLVNIENNDITYLFAKSTGMIANKVNVKVTAANINVNTQTTLGTFTIK
jgi:hypothetical protein